MSLALEPNQRPSVTAPNGERSPRPSAVLQKNQHEDPFAPPLSSVAHRLSQQLGIAVVMIVHTPPEEVINFFTDFLIYDVGGKLVLQG